MDTFGRPDARSHDGEAIVATGRLVLRRFTPRDLDALGDLDNDPEVMKFINNGAPVQRSTVREELEAWLAEYDEGVDFGCWAAIERRSEEFVGWFHLRPAPRDLSRPELGYRLRRQAWGRGLATEGSLGLIDRAFATTPVSEVRAETMAVHAASRRVMARCGMRLVRSFRAPWPVRIPGDEFGDVEYAITRLDWQRQVVARAFDPAPPPLAASGWLDESGNSSSGTRSYVAPRSSLAGQEVRRVSAARDDSDADRSPKS